MLKRKIAGLLTMTMVLASLAGCGQSSVEQSSSGDTSSSSQGGSEIQLSFPCIWVGNDSKAEVFGQMVTGFNEEYEGKYQINIEEQTDYDAYRDKIRTQISTGDAPDIFTVDSKSDLELYASSGKLMDLTEFLSDEEISSRFSEGEIEKGQIDGVNYAFPYESAVIPIMFNQRLLDQVGVTEVPTSFEDLWDVCEALKAADIIPVCQMTNDNAIFSVYWYSYLLAALGGEDVYANGLDDPAFEQAAELMVKMFDYTSSDAVGADATVANGHFFNERAAIYANGTWILGRIKNEGVEGLYDNITVSPGLSINGENGGAYLRSTQAYFVAGKQDDPDKAEAVQAFFEYITDPDKVAELADSSGALFSIEIDSSKLSDPLQAEIVQQSNDAAFTIDYFSAAMPTTVVNAFPAALESLVLGDITPAEFVEQLKAAE